MKCHPALKSVFFLLLTALACTAPSLHAAEMEKKEKEPKVTQKVLNKYDKNHDGKLDADEEATWKADLLKAKADRAAKKKLTDSEGK